MKKILLVNTLPYPDYWQYREEPDIGLPLGLLNIGTALSQDGYSVCIIDPVVERNYLELIKGNLNECLWVGLSTMTNGVFSALEISKYIKSIDKNIPICWGGVHPTLFTESTVENEFVDYVCWGEGEKFAIDFSKFIGGKLPKEQIEGLGYSENGKFAFIPRTYFLDINELGIPNYHLLDMEKYLYRNISISPQIKVKKSKFIAINSAVGCPYSCTFCWNTHPSQKARLKNIELLMANIDYVVKEFNPDIIHLQDDLFFANKRRFLSFLDEYEKRDYRFKWFALCRVNYIGEDYINDEIITRMKKQCLWLGFGIESGSEEIRQKLNKQIGEDNIYDTAYLLGKHDFIASYAFMTGLPFEKREDTVKTVHLMKRIKSLHSKAEFSFQYFRPYPGSPLYEEVIRAGFSPPSKLEEWSILHDKTTSGGVRLDILPWFKENEWSYFVNVVGISLNKEHRVFRSSFKLGYILGIIKDVMFRVSFTVRSFSKYWAFLGFEVKLNKLISHLVSLNRIVRIPVYIKRALTEKEFRIKVMSYFNEKLRGITIKGG